MHNTVATGMAVVFAAIVIGLRWLVPAMPRVFILLGYAYIGVISVLGVFFAIGYYNLTAVELVAAVLIFSWIIVFLRNAGVLRSADGSAARRRAEPERTRERGRMPWHPTPSRCRARRATRSARAPWT